MTTDNIPEELKRLRQWACAGSGSQDSASYKAPIDPATKRWASVSDPSTWGTYAEAMACGYPLVGFMLSENDPYCIIDLDTYKAKDDSVRSLHSEILRHCASYAETSQSGRASHIIGRGSIGRGKRSDTNAIEVYSQGRFMITTGNRINDLGIRDIQPLLEYIRPKLTSVQDGLDWRLLGPGEESNLPDAAIVEMASNAENGDKFDALCRGDLSMHDNDHSRADMALVQFLCYYTTDNTQVARLFMMSKLAEREKAQRRDYVPRTIIRAREQLASDEIPALDLSVLQRRVEQTRAPEAQQTDPPQGIEDSDMFPPGLVGDVARFVLASSRRPVADIALAAGIAAVAGIAARNYNISDTGLNQYILLLAKTGTGKESVQSSLDRLFNAVQKNVPAADRFIGPAAFSSGPALVKRFQAQPCFMSVLGEFGHRLKAMAHPKGFCSRKDLNGSVLDLFAKSGWGQMLRASVYSDSDKNTEVVHAPCLTILGETAPEPFFAGLDDGLIESGFLPRFLTIEYKGDRPKRNKNAVTDPPEALVRRVAELTGTVLQMEQNNICCPVEMSPDALTTLDAFDEYCDQQMRGAAETQRQLWNRAHLKALRLSALVAVGVNHLAPVISKDMAEWTVRMIKRDVNVMAKRFASGDIGDGDGKLRSDLIKVIVRFFNKNDPLQRRFYEKGCVPARYLSQQTASRAAFKNDRRGANRALKETIETMVKHGELAEVSKQQAKEWFGSHAAFYSLGDLWEGEGEE
jgi:hypothetical protein